MLYELMQTRRSVRRFRAEAPTREQIVQLLEAAITAPSASNKQPWRFLVIRNGPLTAAMAAAVRTAVDGIAKCVEPASEGSFRAYGDYFTRFEEAPVVIVTLFRRLTLLTHLVGENLEPARREAIGKMERDSGLIGAAMAMQNLLLMAHEMGLGASGMTGPLVAMEEIRRILEVPPSWEIAAFVAVGYPAETPAVTERKEVDKVVRWME
jgi:nitroreductase